MRANSRNDTTRGWERRAQRALKPAPPGGAGIGVHRRRRRPGSHGLAPGGEARADVVERVALCVWRVRVHVCVLRAATPPGWATHCAASAATRFAAGARWASAADTAREHARKLTRGHLQAVGARRRRRAPARIPRPSSNTALHRILRFIGDRCRGASGRRVRSRNVGAPLKRAGGRPMCRGGGEPTHQPTRRDNVLLTQRPTRWRRRCAAARPSTRSVRF